jgi:hypothetical protein
MQPPDVRAHLGADKQTPSVDIVATPLLVPRRDHHVVSTWFVPSLFLHRFYIVTSGDG